MFLCFPEVISVSFLGKGHLAFVSIHISDSDLDLLRFCVVCRFAFVWFTIAFEREGLLLNKS